MVVSPGKGGLVVLAIWRAWRLLTGAALVLATAGAALAVSAAPAGAARAPGQAS